MRARRLDSELIRSRDLLALLFGQRVARISSLDPWMAVSGVRISWVTKCMACW